MCWSTNLHIVSTIISIYYTTKFLMLLYTEGLVVPNLKITRITQTICLMLSEIVTIYVKERHCSCNQESYQISPEIEKWFAFFESQRANILQKTILSSFHEQITSFCVLIHKKRQGIWVKKVFFIHIYHS